MARRGSQIAEPQEIRKTPVSSAMQGGKIIASAMMLPSGILAHRQARLRDEATASGNPQSAIYNPQSVAGFSPRCVSVAIRQPTNGTSRRGPAARNAASLLRLCICLGSRGTGQGREGYRLRIVRTLLPAFAPCQRSSAGPWHGCPRQGPVRPARAPPAAAGHDPTAVRDILPRCRYRESAWTSYRSAGMLESM